MAIIFGNMNIKDPAEPQPVPATLSGNLRDNLKEEIEAALAQSVAEPSDTILKSETEEAEELFSDIRVSQYVLDMHDLNK